MSKSTSCKYCHNSFPLSSERCPHCARPGLFPNVETAKLKEERDALDLRYQLAKKYCASRGASDSLNKFEKVIPESVAVIARSANEVQRLATSDNQIYSTYYKVIEAELRLPEGDKWDRLRALTDITLFLGYKEKIRFASLSLNRHGLYNYGECSMVLRTDLIAHRASVFEENSILFMKKHDVKLSDENTFPKGYRASWSDRVRLCIAKLSSRINISMQDDEFHKLIMQPGKTSEEDDFVEVHIWGPITARTIEQIIIAPRKNHRYRAKIIKALEEKLMKLGVTIS